MDPSVVLTLTLISVILILGIVSTKLASRIGVPALVLFIGAGMLLGREGLGLVTFEDAVLAQLIATAALVIILFEGGLQTDWSKLRPVALPAGVLATLGVIITAGITGLLTWQILGVALPVAMLFAAIVGSTDAAAIFAVLREREIFQRLKVTVEAESGLNDPMALFLTQVFLTWVQTSSLSISQSLVLMVWQLGVGLVIGLAMGRLVPWILTRIRFDSGGLYPLLLLASAFVTFAVASWIQASGIVAVYVFGIAINGADIPYRQSVVRFHEGLAALSQMVMFTLLGLLVRPSHMAALVGPGILITLGLMFVSRPVAVFLCTLGMGFNWREFLLLAWAGLKGAVPIILATFPLVAGIPQQDLIFHLVFFVVLTSALIQGSTISPLAKWLGLVEGVSRPKAVSLELVAVEECDTDLIEVEITPGAEVQGKLLSELDLPPTVAVSAIVRHKQVVTPRGNTRIEPGDVLFILAGKGSRERVLDVFTGEGRPTPAPAT